MANITKPNTFTSGTTILSAEVNSNFDTIYNEFNGSITNANISASAAISPSKISGTAVTLGSTETISGDKTFSGSTSFVGATPINFEGPTADDYETSLAITDPTADRTITIPDADVDLTAASAAEVKTGTDIAKRISAATMVNHEGVVKGWASVSYSGGTPTLEDSFNVTGIADTAQGKLTITWATDFGSANYSVVSTCFYTSSDTYQTGIFSIAAGSVGILVEDNSASDVDPANIYVIAIGDR